MDCIHARMALALQSRDASELDAEARAALEQHLEVCADCQAWAHHENRIDDALGAAIRAVAVPAGLPSKILHTLEARRPRRRGLAWAGAAAACLVLGLSLAGYFWLTDKPELTIDPFVTPVIAKEKRSPQEVEEWFADLGLPIEIPRALVPEHYHDHGVARIAGQRIPRIDYVVLAGNGEGRSAVAEVYILAKNRFNLTEMLRALEQAPGPIVTSNHRIEVRQFDEHPGYIYIIIYTGGSLQPFLVASPPSA
ncbi:MAG: zf-HC2 domain-containing protein [Gemmataceae bacterium]|nr:zf-HC2 domain-containing protein [Gemmataceae bacterium]